MGRFEEKFPGKIHTTFQIKERVIKIGEQNGTVFKSLKKTWRFKKNMKRLSFISQFKSFYYHLLVVEKCLKNACLDSFLEYTHMYLKNLQNGCFSGKFPKTFRAAICLKR